MQTEYSSYPESRLSIPSRDYDDQIINVGFTINSQDSSILQEYLEEFKKGDTGLWTRIIEKAMAELYILRPADTQFDKNEARTVCCMDYHCFSI